MAFNTDGIHDDIQIGDYFILKGQIFIVLDVKDNEYIISPPSRQHQTLRFYRHNYVNENEDYWVIANSIPGDRIKDWNNSNAPEVEYLTVTWEHEGDPYENGDIILIKSEDVKINYLQLRDILVQYALRDETDESIPFKNYTVTDTTLYGYDQDLVFNTRSLLGAIITYMDWLDTEKYNIDWSGDEDMWDQQDPNIWSSYINPDESIRVVGLVEEFLERYADLFELQKSKVFGFLFSTQPQIKAIR